MGEAHLAGSEAHLVGSEFRCLYFQSPEPLGFIIYCLHTVGIHKGKEKGGRKNGGEEGRSEELSNLYLFSLSPNRVWKMRILSGSL